MCVDIVTTRPQVKQCRYPHSPAALVFTSPVSPVRRYWPASSVFAAAGSWPRAVTKNSRSSNSETSRMYILP